jgi:hypothetical protein
LRSGTQSPQEDFGAQASDEIAVKYAQRF